VPPLSVGQVLRGLAPRGQRTRVFTLQEEQAVLGFMRTRRWRGRQLHAMFRTMFLVGSRRAETLALTVGDYDPVNKTLRFRAETTKGKKTRVVPCDPVAAELDELTRGKTPESPLFGVGRATVSRAWAAMRMKLGYTHPELVIHAVRHTVGTRLARTSGLAQAQAMLGHSAANTTMRYVHLELDDLRAAQRTLCHPHGTVPTEPTGNDKTTT